MSFIKTLNLSWFGVPQGLLVAAGCLSFSVGIVEGGVDVENRKLVLGGFLISVGWAWHYLHDVWGWGTVMEALAAFAGLLVFSWLTWLFASLVC